MFKSQILNQARRTFATTTAASNTTTPINASLVLSRIPIVTPEVPEFEQLFYNYQEELERRLMWTFPRWYYFKKGTVAEREFSQAQNYPIPAHKGVWFPKGVPDIKHGRDRRFKQEVILPKKNIEGSEEADLEDVARPIKPNSRITKFDEINDQTSLERKLPRTLYLLVKDETSSNWKFPTFKLKDEEISLNQIAEDGLRTIGGVHINTWSVSNTPAAVVKYNKEGSVVSSGETDKSLTRDFLMKSHIVSGKFVLQKASDIKEYKWLVKEEIKDLVDGAYFKEINHILADI